MAYRSSRASARSGPLDGSAIDVSVFLACLVFSLIALLLPDAVAQQHAARIRRTALAPLSVVQQRAERMRAGFTSRDSALMVDGANVARLHEAAELAEENTRLRELLGLGARLRQGFVIADAFSPLGPVDNYTLRIAAGSESGIVSYAPVVNGDGLVGMIDIVDAQASRAITWAHPDFRVSAMSIDETAFGIVQPFLGGGPTRYLLEMRGVPFRNSLDSGTVIVSSGLGATYPRGIPIGTVVREVSTTERWARTYLLTPSVLLRGLSAVAVLAPAGTEARTLSAWRDIRVMDSVRGALVAAGDSLERQRAIAEIQARRSALDSLGAALGIPDSSPAAPWWPEGE